MLYFHSAAKIKKYKDSVYIEPIIPRELFDEAQKRLTTQKKTIKAKDEPALFAGLFYFEACGTSMKLGVSQQKQTATMKRDLALAKKRLTDLDVKLKRYGVLPQG